MKLDLEWGSEDAKRADCFWQDQPYIRKEYCDASEDDDILRKHLAFKGSHKILFLSIQSQICATFT